MIFPELLRRILARYPLQNFRAAWVFVYESYSTAPSVFVLLFPYSKSEGWQDGVEDRGRGGIEKGSERDGKGRRVNHQ
jgi:hypothetical protein